MVVGKSRGGGVAGGSGWWPEMGWFTGLLLEVGVIGRVEGGESVKLFLKVVKNILLLLSYILKTIIIFLKIIFSEVQNGDSLVGIRALSDDIHPLYNV